jgi:hypothetical protein
MKRFVLAALVGCTRPPVTSDAAPSAAVDASFEAGADVAVDASVTPPPTACSDAGPPAWYIVAKGDECSTAPMLEWLDDRTPHLFTALPPLLGAFAWTAELPACFGANAVVTKVQTIDEHTFQVTIEGYDNGGMGCHARFTTRFDGKVVVDENAALVRADFSGTETTVADDKPSCRGMNGMKRVAAHVRRSCTP